MATKELRTTRTCTCGRNTSAANDAGPPIRIEGASLIRPLVIAGFSTKTRRPPDSRCCCDESSKNIIIKTIPIKRNGIKKKIPPRRRDRPPKSTRPVAPACAPLRRRTDTGRYALRLQLGEYPARCYGFRNLCYLMKYRFYRFLKKRNDVEFNNRKEGSVFIRSLLL
ncbi:hypothetical protein EVAR_13033_1 [Eumeta japonica]|uniref:Uncharacterized protein n=1 Tax=Eumeta variegata TaxID=151549 RepID=A0A4C1VJA3_EUMVA|nr:hypothetical protein EVAR_13033_1 [Eumeta japonica]